MESNDMKLAWQELNRRMERQEALVARQARMASLGRVRSALWPLAVGQVVQMAFGVLAILLGTGAWREYDAVPVFASGLIMHVYGILLIVLAGVMLDRVRKIDYAAPVTEIQLQLARLRVFYIRCGMAVGLPWWVLWVPFSIAASAVLFNVDMYARMPLALNASIGFGFAGLFATWLFRRWSLHPSRSALRSRLENSAAGSSLRKAEQRMDEIVRFEKE